MKERIDNFMKVVREKHRGEKAITLDWTALYTRLMNLVDEREDKSYLEKEWDKHKQELAAISWDESFLKLSVNGPSEVVSGGGYAAGGLWASITEAQNTITSSAMGMAQHREACMQRLVERGIKDPLGFFTNPYEK